MFGVPVRVHLTFPLLLVFLGIRDAQAGLPVLDGQLLYLALFACVLLHEFGHVLAARRFGVATKDVTLLPFGGLARLERMPERPVHELWVALAGPAVNVVIAVALFAFLAATGRLPRLTLDGITGLGFLAKLAVVNTGLVLFNLLPAFPMDGGRVVRALLAMVMPYPRATRIAARLGIGMAVLFALWGMTGGNLMLFVIAFFIWLGATAETQQAEVKSVVAGVTVRDAMLTEFHTLESDQSLADAARLLLEGSQSEFPVMDQGRVLGLLTRDALVKGLADSGPARRAGDADLAPLRTVDSNARLEDVMASRQDGESGAFLVAEAGRLVGLLTSENIGEFVMIRSALATRAASSRPPVLPEYRA